MRWLLIALLGVAALASADPRPARCATKQTVLVCVERAADGTCRTFSPWREQRCWRPH